MIKRIILTWLISFINPGSQNKYNPYHLLRVLTAFLSSKITYSNYNFAWGKVKINATGLFVPSGLDFKHISMGFRTFDLTERTEWNTGNIPKCIRLVDGLKLE